MSRRRKQSLYENVKAAIRSRYLQCFVDPAEIRLLTILGGSVLTIGQIKRDGRPMSIVLSRGHLLRSEKFKRIAIDNRTILFMNDIDQVLAIQGNDYQYDVLRYQEQEERLLARGLRVKYIPQQWIENNPMRALQSVKQFIYS